jgi:predicted kinase
MRMAELFFLQMSGVPGAGKTTLARAIARELDTVVIDHDITKSALLAANVPVALAGGASYSVLNAVACHLLGQGHSVIFDSPCFYTELLERGQTLARQANAAYRYIECVLADLHQIDRRLQTRPRLPSQLTGVYTSPSAGSGKTEAGESVFRDWMANMKRPATGYLVVNTAESIDSCLTQALDYLLTGRGNR